MSHRRVRSYATKVAYNIFLDILKKMPRDKFRKKYFVTEDILMFSEYLLSQYKRSKTATLRVLRYELYSFMIFMLSYYRNKELHNIIIELTFEENIINKVVKKFLRNTYNKRELNGWYRATYLAAKIKKRNNILNLLKSINRNINYVC